VVPSLDPVRHHLKSERHCEAGDSRFTVVLSQGLRAQAHRSHPIAVTVLRHGDLSVFKKVNYHLMREYRKVACYATNQ
jgi:hypothetical protein